MTKKILIDGDSIAYKAGYAESLTLCYQVINNTMARIFKDCNSKDYEIYVEEFRKPKSSFRRQIYSQYKTRKPQDKCRFLAEAKMYLTFTWHARVVDIFESEDRVVRRAFELGPENCIVACIDKDLLCQPLTFYNYDEKNSLGKGLGVEIPAGTIYTVSKDEATLHLYRQMLAGDTVDTVPGVKGIGKVNACKLVDDASIAALQAAQVYCENGLSYEDYLLNYNLLKIREENTTDILKPISEQQFRDNLNQ